MFVFMKEGLGGISGRETMVEFLLVSKVLGSCATLFLNEMGCNLSGLSGWSLFGGFLKVVSLLMGCLFMRPANG